MSRIPFVAAVVGALLIGGATTGGTHASWVQKKDLASSSINAGRLDFNLAAPSPIPSINKGFTGNVIVTLTDDSLGRNLNRSLTSTGSATGGATVALKTVDANGACTSTNLGAYTGAFAGVQKVCAQVAVPTGFAGTSLTLTITTVGQQTGLSSGGWSRMRQLDVTVPITGNILNCGTQTTKNEMPVGWVNPAGVTKAEVQWSASQNGTYATLSGSASQPAASSFTITQTTVGDLFYKVKFTGGSVPVSNIIKITRENNQGNSNLSYCGAP